MTKQMARTVHTTSAVAAGIAALLSPIPLGDEIVFVPMYGWLARRMARSHGLGWMATPWRAMARTTFNGLVARGTINLAVSRPLNGGGGRLFGFGEFIMHTDCTITVSLGKASM